MAIHLGNPVSDAYLGDSKINEMYLGAEKVYEIPSNFVRIGEHDYPYVKIGNLLWTSENLREDLQGKVLPPNGDATNIQSMGLLYYQRFFGDISGLLSDGWRLPLKSDYDNLVSNIDTFKDLISKAWNSGTNATGFNALPAGNYNGYSKAYSNFNLQALFWLYTGKTDNGDIFGIDGGRYYFSTDFNTSYFGFPIRLCKDA